MKKLKHARLVSAVLLVVIVLISGNFRGLGNYHVTEIDLGDVANRTSLSVVSIKGERLSDIGSGDYHGEKSSKSSPKKGNEHGSSVSSTPVDNAFHKVATTMPLLADTMEGNSRSISNSSSGNVIQNNTRVAFWWTEYINTTWRVFPRWQGTPYDWCILEKTPTPDELPPGQLASGFLYVKSHKAASSTCEGIHLHISHQVARRKFPNTTAPVCIHYNRHEFANSKGHGQKTSPSLLWTMVRHPAKRDVSQIFHFRVSRTGMPATEANLLGALQQQQLRGIQTRYLLSTAAMRSATHPSYVEQHPRETADMISRQILEYYDFIGVVEFMYESLAVMTLLWDLSPSDVIVMNSKQAGGYDAGGKRKKCTKIVPSRLFPAVESYLDSPQYQRPHADFLLYYAVVESLHRTMDSLGRERVQERVQHLQRLQQLVESECAGKAIFPCSRSGEVQFEASQANCYVQDAGCGYPCVNDVLSNRTYVLAS